ncbi:MAG: class I tRNA ligase family protein, partial [Rikenellaceae bacterium]
IIERYGADTLRMYEMFLGPLEQSKPWDTNGIDGVAKFIRKFWRMFFNEAGELVLSDEQPTAAEMKILHKTIKKVESDIENFSFNTSVSAFMICVNELGALKCSKRAILQPLTILLAPYIPHTAEELWSLMGEKGTICDAKFPLFKEKYLTESEFEYPISFNGKVRFKQNFPLDMESSTIEKTLKESDQTIKYLEGKEIKKFIVVKGRIINIVY